MADINLEIRPTEKRELRISAFGPSKDDGAVWLMINSINPSNKDGKEKTEAMIKLSVNNNGHALEICRAINGARRTIPRVPPLQPYRLPEPSP